MLMDLFRGQLAEERARFVNWVPVLFAAGIWAYFALKTEPGYPAAVLPLAVGLVAMAMSAPAGGRRLLAVMLVIAGLGFVTAKLRTAVVAAPVLGHTLRAAEVTGIIERREPHAGRAERLTLRLTSLAGVEPQGMPRRARIRVLSPAGDVKPGDRLRLIATLSPPAAPALPGGYDFARAAYFEQIGAVGYALKPPEKLADANAEPPLALRVRAAVEDLRQEIGRRIQAALPGERGALAAALITGERGGISQETTDAYRDSGLVHILSISGLHMAIMAGAVFASIRFVLAAIPALALTQPIKKWAAAGGAAGAILYYTISGGSAATLRSAIMMVVIFFAIVLGRPAIAMRNVAIAALVILVLFPESLLDAGFQMSFAAVAALVAAYEAFRWLMARKNLVPGSIMRAVLFLGGILFSTVVAGLAVTPLSIYHFHAMQHYAPLANLAAVPICNLIVMPAALATLVAMPFGLEAAPLWIMGWGLDAMGFVARYVADLPGAVTRIPQVPDAAFALVLAGGLWLVLWHQKWRLAGIPLIIAGLTGSAQTDRPDLLVGREGSLVAVRDQSGRLAAQSDRPSTFELTRWLEHDGDARDPKAARRTPVFRCDPLGCATLAGGDALAISRHPASIADDCTRAKILIVDGARPRDCETPLLLLDRTGLKTSGTVALYRRLDGTYATRSVADVRGSRPWSTPHHHEAERRPPVPERPRPDNGSPARLSTSPTGTARHAAPANFAESTDSSEELRPDVEDDDGSL